MQSKPLPISGGGDSDEPDHDDVSALIGLLRYAELEAERLGLDEAAQLLDMPIRSICQARADSGAPGLWCSEAKDSSRKIN